MMHTPMKSEMSVNVVASSSEMIPLKANNNAQKTDVDSNSSSSYSTKSYNRKKHHGNNASNYQYSENTVNGNGSASVSPRRRFPAQNQNQMNNNKRMTGNHSRRNSQTEIKNLPKPKEQQPKSGKSRKFDQQQQDSLEGGHSERSISPPSSSPPNGYNHNGTEESNKQTARTYTPEILHAVRQQMGNGKYQQTQQNGVKKGDMDLSILRSALNGGLNESNIHLLYGSSFYANPLMNTPQKQQQQIMHNFGQYSRGPPSVHHHYSIQNNYKSNYYNRNYQPQEEHQFCKCGFSRNVTNTIFCAHCRYPVRRTASFNNSNYNNNKNRFNRHNSYSSYQNSYQNSNRNASTNHKNTKNRQDFIETGSSGSNDSYNGKYSNKYHSNNNNTISNVNSTASTTNQKSYTILSSRKSLSPTPTPSSSSKSESPTNVDNPQNDSGSAKSITFGNFDVPSDEYSSSNSSPSCSSTSLQTQQETENFSKSQTVFQQPQTEIYVQETQQSAAQQQQFQPQSPMGYVIFNNFYGQGTFGTPYPPNFHYQPTQQPQQTNQQWANGNGEADNQNYQKRR